MTEEKRENTVKCVAIGDSAVGKTCLLLTYATEEFPTKYIPTVFDTYVSTLKVNEEDIQFELWDTAGSENLDLLRPMSYVNADMFLIVYSVVDKESFGNVESKWVKDIKEKAAGTGFVIAGNKVDMRGTKDFKVEDCVSKEALEDLADKVGAANCFEASAKTKENLNEIFQFLISESYQKMKGDQGSGEDGESENKSGKVRTGCVCVLL